MSDTVSQQIVVLSAVGEAGVLRFRYLLEGVWTNVLPGVHAGLDGT
ncbi:MAG: hypothetical protein QOE28_1943 [Solirubrobacteraceae bacterium]|nr:hypothetical protein [Solirubrobacteraceae bacterium]